MPNQPRMLPHAIGLIALMFLTGCGGEGPNKTVSPNTLSFDSLYLPIGIVGESYNESLSVSGGQAPYTFEVVATSLPPGVAVDGISDQVYFAGEPTDPGTYLFSVKVTDADKVTKTENITAVVVTAVQVAGTWTYHTVVTLANGVCDGEEGDSGNVTVTVTQSGSNVTVSGLLGLPGNEISGNLANNLLTLTGSYPEDGGTTTGTHSLVVYSPDFLAGIERWNWVGPGGSCPGSTSAVSATKQP